MAYLKKDLIQRSFLARAARVNEPEWLAQNFLDEMFTAISTPRLSDEWAHVGAHSMGTASKVMSPNIDALRYFVGQYNASPEWQHTDQIDWLLSDSLCYAEVNQFMIQIGYPRFLGPEGPKWGLLSLYVVGKIFLWALWLLVAVVAIQWSGWAIAAWLFMTASRQWIRYKQRKARNDLVIAMLDAYQTLDAMLPSWEYTFDALKKAGSLGAKWPTELLRLVESKANH